MKLSLKAILLPLLTLMACSGDPYSFTYKPVAEQAHILAIPNTTANAATVVARREPSYTGAYDVTHFTLDGVPVVRLRAGEEHSFRISPGQHLVGGVCEGLVRRGNETAMTAEPGRTYIFRIYSGDAGHCQIAPMSR